MYLKRFKHFTRWQATTHMMAFADEIHTTYLDKQVLSTFMYRRYK